ncbi:MAG: PAS domain S-box protein [Thermomicrobiales bacterium]|nr:PAS domain S-box protein [Thermomicrobiales bacterium]
MTTRMDPACRRAVVTADRCRPLLDGSAGAALIIDADGRCVDASQAAEAMLGYPRDTLRDIPASAILDDHLSGSGTAGSPRRVSERWQGRKQVRTRGGRLLPVDAWAVDLADASTLVLLRRAPGGEDADGDTPAEAEMTLPGLAAIRESNALYREAFDAASIGMALVTIDGQFLQVNPSLCETLGYPEDELLATTFREITLPGDRDLDRDLERQLLAKEITTYQIEKHYVRKPGDVICGRLTVSLVRNRDDEPSYIVAQIQDITPFKAAGAALRAAEERYRTLVEQIAVVVYVDAADSDGTPLYVSPRIETMLGYTAEEWMSSPDFWAERIHPDDRDRVVAELRKMSKAQTPIFLEYRYIARDGRIVWVHDEAALVRDEDGAPQYWQGFMVDITDRKRAEDELRAAKEAAEEASRLKSAFLSMATHELRTPLTIISGYVELLAESARDHLTDEEREFLDVAQSSTKTLAALVDDLLDLARIEAGRLDLMVRPVNIADAIERVRRLVAAQAAAKGIDLAIDVAPDLPLIAADINRLVQVLLNLFGNAVKFTERGSVRCTIRQAGAGVEIRIEDTGVGIPPESLPRIFDEFRQADSGTTRRFGGSGLGLAIARRLVEMHGGTIRATSQVGIGSVFTLWLPAADATLIDEEAKPPASKARAKGDGRAGRARRRASSAS